VTIDPIAAILLFLVLVVLGLLHVADLWQRDREADRLHRLLHRLINRGRRW
jgi:hypothetical protein